MNVTQRSVLKQHFRQLANDIILTDSLLGAMYQAQIFERNMIDIIKAEKTEGDKVCKMLELLPKRGPGAFDSFLEIIQSDYPWLAAMLNSSVKHETSSRGATKPDLKADNDCTRTSLDLSTIDTDLDLKTLVGTFIHKQFGHSKRISESDKKLMIRWMSQVVHNDRRRQHTSASSSRKMLESADDKRCGTDKGSQTDDENGTEVNNQIQELYKKLQEFKKDNKIRIPQQFGIQNDNLSTKSQSSSEANKSANQNNRNSPGYLESITHDVQYLMDKVHEAESEVNKCYMMLGNKNKSLSLSLLIYDMSLSARHTEKELKQEKQKSDKMLNELYEYSKNVTQLEQGKAKLDLSVVTQCDDINSLKHELEKCKNHITQLEQQSKLHTEKQRTLENLKSMVRDLQNTGRSGTRASTDSYTKVPGSRQIPRYGQAKTTEAESKSQSSLSRKYSSNHNPFRRKNNPSTYK